MTWKTRGDLTDDQCALVAAAGVGEVTWKTPHPEEYEFAGPPPDAREFLERMAENIAKTTIAMGGSVSTAYKVAGMWAEACEALWQTTADTDALP